MDKNTRILWFRWIAANALAEMIGLGATFAAIGLFGSKLAEPQTTAGILSAFAIAVISGSIEATIVGLSQWWAMHPWFPQVKIISWWGATLVGALIGYILGYLPSTLMSMGETAGQASAVEPPQWVVLILAAGLGAVAGAVLSSAQWLVLRGKVNRSDLWIPANMLAWALGMPVIFQTMDWAFRMPHMWQSVLVVAAGLLAAGTIVGAVHGRFLVHLAGLAQPADEPIG